MSGLHERSASRVVAERLRISCVGQLQRKFVVALASFSVSKYSLEESNRIASNEYSYSQKVT